MGPSCLRRNVSSMRGGPKGDFPSNLIVLRSRCFLTFPVGGCVVLI